MPKKVNYRKASVKIRQAWIAYKNASRGSAVSLLDFVAGYNAAKSEKEEKCKSKN